MKRGRSLVRCGFPGLAMLLMLAGFAHGSTLSPLPSLVKQNGRYALLVDGAPFLMLSAQVNNSSNWPAMLPKVWPAVAQLHANTVEVPIAWQQVEPREGEFDFSFLDTLLVQAREQRVRLVLLWFGTWKNNGPGYAPEWVKLNNKRFPRVVNAKGTTRDSLSPNFQATLAADRKAFVALMRQLKERDAERWMSRAAGRRDDHAAMEDRRATWFMSFPAVGAVAKGPGLIARRMWLSGRVPGSGRGCRPGSRSRPGRS